jgi:hypothetical protein
MAFEFLNNLKEILLSEVAFSKETKSFEVYLVFIPPA